jgi:medium-chain acyl-[acyl-carrier-protein] hydrolase
MPTRDDKRIAVLKRAVGPPTVTLICVPFAGGNPEVFGPWAEWLIGAIDLLAVRLPGHGRRMRDAPFETWDELVDDTYQALTPYVSHPHAFYGHCFGGRLAYELAHRAADRHATMTKRLFISGCRSPDALSPGEHVHRLPNAEFCSALARTGAAPAEVLGNDALMRILLPAIRSEIRLAELWADRHGASLDVPITAMYGHEDPTWERLGMRGWVAYSTRECEFIEVPGGHFFIQANPPLLRETINSRLAVSAWNA